MREALLRTIGKLVLVSTLFWQISSRLVLVSSKLVSKNSTEFYLLVIAGERGLITVLLINLEIIKLECLVLAPGSVSIVDFNTLFFKSGRYNN